MNCASLLLCGALLLPGDGSQVSPGPDQAESRAPALPGPSAVEGCPPDVGAIPEGATPAARVDGYRGIWFSLGQRSQYGDKYSGGLGTYTAKHRPLAVYAPEVDRTFFVYGGTTDARERHLLAMVSFFDHRCGVVPRASVVHDKKTVDDPHDNPALNLDGQGHLWVFVSGRGRKRPGYVYRSVAPWGINAFERVRTGEFTYPQPWWVDGQGWLFLFTRYTGGRELFWSTSADGEDWSPARKLAAGGHYQVSRARDGVVATAFSIHPDEWNVDQRTNLYFVQSSDMGLTWTTADGAAVVTPVSGYDNAALVRDYRREGLLVYLKDIQIDPEGHPVLLYLTSRHHQPGPDAGPRTWTIARWSGTEWLFHEVTTSAHNYDMGSLHLTPEGPWRIIGPTEEGPQPWGTGGEIALWESTDRGASWRKTRAVTRGSSYNHGYVRRPLNARPGFYAFWADGDPEALSPSRLYFTNEEGSPVWQLPDSMGGEAFASPQPID